MQNRPHPDIPAQALKGHCLDSSMKYDCVCLLLIMATLGSCNDDKILAITLYAAGIQPPPATPSRKKKCILIINKLFNLSSGDSFDSCLQHRQFSQKFVLILYSLIIVPYFIISLQIDQSKRVKYHS